MFLVYGRSDIIKSPRKVKILVYVVEYFKVDDSLQGHDYQVLNVLCGIGVRFKFMCCRFSIDKLEMF